MSGIGILRRILMKQAMKKSKDTSGIMSLNKGLVDDVDNTVKKWIDSAKRQGQDIDKMGEQEIKYIVELNKPKAPRTLQELMDKIGLNDPKKNRFLQKEADVVDLTGKKIDTSKGIMGGKNVPEEEGFSMTIAEGPQTGKKITIDEFFEMTGAKNKSKIDIVTDTVTKIKTMEPVAAMKEANLVIGRKGKYKNLTVEESQKILKDTDDWIFQRDPDDLWDHKKNRPFRDDPDYDPEDFAQGGRASTGLNYLLGEDDQNTRVPYANGSSQSEFDQYLRDREQMEKEKQKKDFLDDFKKWKKWKETEGGTIDFAAEGGRIGFGIGGMTRRAFLKLMGGTAAGVGAAKSGLLGFLKSGKPAIVKELTQVPIKNIEGMPAWFKPLVNKVIKEGTEVGGEAERIIVHKSQLPNSKTDVYVTQDLNTGDVAVEIGSGKHGFADGHLGQPVRLEYKAAEDIYSGPDMDDMHKVGVRDPHIKVKRRNEMTFDQKKYPDKKPEEFWVEEAEFTGGHPENVKFEESTFNKFGEHGSDFSEVEKFATGKVKKAKTTESKFLGKKYLSEGDDMASGGRVPMVFGGRTLGVLKNLLTKMKKSHGVGRGEKSLKPDPFAKRIMSEEDKLKLLQIETKYANSVLEHLKADRQLFKQLETNREMKDQGLDFLMKHFVDTQAPHMKNYKSLADIDNAILELETLVKNKTLKEGRQLNATGGRVPLAGGSSPMHGNYSVDEILEFKKQLIENGYSPGEANDYVRWLLKRNKVLEFPSVGFSAGGLAHMLGE